MEEVRDAVCLGKINKRKRKEWLSERAKEKKNSQRQKEALVSFFFDSLNSRFKFKESYLRY